MLPILQRHWFLLALACILLVGMSFPAQSADAAQAIPKNWVIACVLFLMALPMSFDTIWDTLRGPGAAMLAIFINSIAVPLIAWPASHLLPGDLATGLVIVAAVPCTIASATVWTRLAGGNEAISMLVTVITNMACFVVTPAWIWLILGKESSTQPFGEMARELFLLVVLPILAAQLLRRIPSIAEMTTVRKPAMSIVAQIGLLSIVFIGAVASGQKLQQLDGHLGTLSGQLGWMLLVVAGVHLLAFYLGLWLARQLGYRHSDSLAVGFAGSQKTLMVGLAIALNFGGLAILPMVAYHVEQLVIDTLLAQRYRKKS